MANFGRSTYMAWGNLSLDLLDINSHMTAHTDVIDTTRYGTVDHDFEPGYTDPGSITVTVGTDRVTDVTALLQAHADHTKSTLSIVTAVGRQISYSAFITDISHILDKNGLYTLQVTFKLSGAPTYKAYENYKIIPDSQSITMYYGCSYGLFLAGNDTDFGGGAVNWSITSDHATDTKIVGNTLIISPTETHTSITVKGTFRAIMELNDYPTATYDLRAPPVSSITLHGKTLITLDVTAASTEEVYKITAYPTGGSQNATYKLLRNGSVPPVNNGIKINQGTGVLLITHETYAEHYGRNEVFVVEATSANYPDIKDELMINVVRDWDPEQAQEATNANE